jgi:hypothetical protein
VGVDRVLARLAAEEGGELADGAAVRERSGDVGPLARVGALGEQAPEPVEIRRQPGDRVRVMVDERDAVQYFKKWPCCSNASSPAE